MSNKCLHSVIIEKLGEFQLSNWYAILNQALIVPFGSQAVLSFKYREFNIRIEGAGSILKISMQSERGVKQYRLVAYPEGSANSANVSVYLNDNYNEYRDTFIVDLVELKPNFNKVLQRFCTKMNLVEF